ncbi:MAG: HAMP domain-containing histidine kinase [Oscillospiraceae bacterium]|jgi:signal transduction histidine kinase|nr:HAMP domain-containing histidine kinase [Oscillospiraceae bacterium]
MRNSVYFRIFIATALIVLVSFSLLGGLSTALSYRRTMADKRAMMANTLRETSKYITTQHQHYEVELNDLDMSMWLTTIAGVTGFDLLVTNADGVVEACSEMSFLNIGKTVPETILQTLDLGQYSVVRSTMGQIYPERRQISGIPLTMLVDGDPNTFGYLFVSSDIAEIGQEWRSFSTAFILLALSVMLIAFIIAFLSLKKQAEPLNEMANAARRFARGEFDVRVKDLGRIDELGQLTEAFNAMADSLESSEQLRRDFIANLSHELKTPMTVISGFAEGLLDGTIPREHEERYLKIISSETRRMSRLVRSMTEVTTLGEAKTVDVLKGRFDIAEVVRLALLSLSKKIDNKRLNVDAKLPDERIFTRGDKDSITQVVFNIIDNAIKYSNKNSTLELELWQRGQRVFVSIANQGETIPKKELPHIFERFHKADKSRGVDREGVGLGLYIVKRILDNHNEDIFVTSENGVTKFIFSLTVA